MRIAVVGGIASGKSEVLRLLKELNQNVVSADQINEKLLKNPLYVEKLAKAFPTVVQQGTVDKKALSAIIFSDDNARKKLNELAHPYIIEQMNSSYFEPITFYEIPLFSLVKDDFVYDKLWFVYTNKANRIKRLCNRNNWTVKQAKVVIELQQNEDNLKRFADVIINNNGTQIELKEQVVRLIQHT